MAFNVLAQVGEPITTVKDTEIIRVQVVQITNKEGKATNRVEARVFVTNNPGGYNGPTKTALVFDDAADIDSLIAALTEAKGQAALGTLQTAPVVKKARAKRVVKAA